MKRVLALPAAVLLLGTAACSSPQVVVEAAITQESTGETLPLQDLPIRLLPYDRDAIFDSLEAAYTTPEPPIPPALLQARAEVIAAQEEHAAAEARWGMVRDSLRAISQTTERMNAQGLRGTPQYLQAFESFDRLEAEEARVKREMDAAFARFTELQEATLFQMDSIRVARETWAQEAFADFGLVVEAHLDRVGALVEPEPGEQAEPGGEALLAVPALVGHVVELRELVRAPVAPHGRKRNCGCTGRSNMMSGMDFSLTEAERDLVGLCRDFAQKEPRHRPSEAEIVASMNRIIDRKSVV